LPSPRRSADDAATEQEKLKTRLSEQEGKVKGLRPRSRPEGREQEEAAQAQLEAAKEEQADTEKKLGGGRRAQWSAAQPTTHSEAVCTNRPTAVRASDLNAVAGALPHLLRSAFPAWTEADKLAEACVFVGF
jgi:chromosome segregation ATPase